MPSSNGDFGDDKNDEVVGGSSSPSDDTVSISLGGEPLIMSDAADGSSSSLRRRPPFVSSFRHTLDRIRTDSVQNRHHPVGATTANTNNNSGRSLLDGGAPTWHQGLKARIHKKLQEKTRDDWVAAVLPCWAWLRTYPVRQNLPADLMAGLTVGLMIVPQSMSYAKLAGLPVEFGLYSALIPVYAYSLFGTSRQLAVGPVALISLLLSTGLSQVMETRSVSAEDPNYDALYAQLAIQCSFLVGIIYIGMGLLQAGFVTIFLSHAVISGFTTGAAVIIGMSQVKYLFGYDVVRSDRLQELLESIFSGIEQFNYRPFLMGCSSILMLLFFKHVGKTYPKYKWVRAAGPLFVTVLALVLVVALNLENRGIAVVGTIPKGFPGLTVKEWTPLSDVKDIILVVISIVIVGFMESIAIAKQLASKHKYEIDSSQELIGLGMANFLGSAFSAYPVTGSFSRSAVNNEAGATSGVAGMVTATIVCFVLLFLTAFFEKLPLSVLGAIVISGVLGLLDYDEAMYLWRVRTKKRAGVFNNTIGTSSLTNMCIHTLK